jgi:predicted NAD/FAD-dependent oxidoreductase
LYREMVCSSGSVAVIGAGLAGVSAAGVIADAGYRIVIFEKSRGLGGRCATKRWEGHTIDHGAQYFTMRDADFRGAVGRACGEDVMPISAPIVAGNGDALVGEGRFYHRSGNSRLARALLGEIEARTGIEVGPVEGRTINGEVFDAIVATTPLPQTLRLAGIDGRSVSYVPCLTAILLYDGDPDGLAAELYAVSDRSGHPLAWSACENHKSGRILPGSTVLIAQASEAFSREWLEAPPEDWGSRLRVLAEERWEMDAGRFRALHAHRWRYARVAHAMEIPPLPDGWFFAGDAVSESRVEAAWLAGRDAGRRVALFLAK